MLGIFKKLYKGLEIKAPVKGRIIRIEDVDDPVFAKKVVGDGIAIDPTDNKILSPVNGEVVQVFPTKHAVGLITGDNVEILIHIGLETVALKGEGFKAHVKTHDRVKVGDPLITFDMDILREKAKSLVIPIVITNHKKMKSITKMEGKVNSVEDTIMLVKPI